MVLMEDAVFAQKVAERPCPAPLRNAPLGRNQPLFRPHLRPEPTNQDQLEVGDGRVVSGRCEDALSTNCVPGGGNHRAVPPPWHPRAEGTAEAMQIRLTVLAPRSGHAAARACDVLVTAPAGTALAAVASGLASAASGAEASGASVVLYAGARAARRPAPHPGRATPGGRRGALARRPRRGRAGPRRPGPGPAARGGGARRGRRPPAARRPHRHRPRHRVRRPAGRSRRLAPALRGDGRRGRPGERRRPELDERHPPRRHGRSAPGRSGSRPARCCGSASPPCGSPPGGPEAEPSPRRPSRTATATSGSPRPHGTGAEQAGPAAPAGGPPSGDTAYGFGHSRGPPLRAYARAAVRRQAHGGGFDALGAPSGYGARRPRRPRGRRRRRAGGRARRCAAPGRPKACPGRTRPSTPARTRPTAAEGAAG